MTEKTKFRWKKEPRFLQLVAWSYFWYYSIKIFYWLRFQENNISILSWESVSPILKVSFKNDSSSDHYIQDGYLEAAFRAAQLWQLYLPQTSPVLSLVHSDSTPSDELINYKQRLESVGCRVELHHSANISCATVSQVIRLISAYLYDSIEEEDLIITGSLVPK